MTTVQAEKIARRKLSLLQLAQELGNVSKACRIVGYSRQQFYEIRRSFQLHGADGLLDRLPGAKGPHPNRVPAPVEEAILAQTLEHPTHGAQRVADELMLRGIQVSSGGVRGVWMRNDLQTRHHRLLRLEETVQKRKIKLSEEQIQALERFDPEYRERHIEVNATGELVAVDTFFAGTLKGVGKVYIQTVLDCFSRYVWARLYTSKLPVTAVQILNNHALPFFEDHGLKVQTILSDNGREYCGRPDQHPYELFLQLEEIEHRTTPVGRPQSNGYLERFHRTLLEEHLRIKGRTTWYEVLEEMQKDLDGYLETYNTRRPHRGRGMEGRTPYEVFKVGIPRKPRTRKPSTRKEVKTAA